MLAACSAQGIAVVPVGGGTSVTGGVDTPDLDTVVVCSLDRMSEVQNLDAESGIVTVQAGATGPQLESYLNERGWTLGHFPQSFERATIGGYIATRSSGQSSSGYGRIEDLLVGAELATPVGTLSVGGYPASATGPDLRHVVYWEVRVRWESSPPPTCACERSPRFASTPRRSCPGTSLRPPVSFAP